LIDDAVQGIVCVHENRYHFSGTARNADKRGYNLVLELLAGKHELLRQGIV